MHGFEVQTCWALRFNGFIVKLAKKKTGNFACACIGDNMDWNKTPRRAGTEVDWIG